MNWSSSHQKMIKYLQNHVLIRNRNKPMIISVLEVSILPSCPLKFSHFALTHLVLHTSSLHVHQKCSSFFFARHWTFSVSLKDYFCIFVFWFSTKYLKNFFFSKQRVNWALTLKICPAVLMTLKEKLFHRQIVFVQAILFASFFPEGDQQFQLLKKDCC